LFHIRVIHSHKTNKILNKECIKQTHGKPN
jgi:hypothetical protein